MTAHDQNWPGPCVALSLRGICFAPNCHYRVMIDGQDWYWWDGERVQGIPSKAGGWQDPPDVDSEILMRGTMVDDAEFKRITDLAMADLRWLEPSS